MPLTAIAYETEAVPTNGPQIAHRQLVASLTGVTKRYGNALALDRLNLSLRPGEIVALLGPNGAGKSTAIKLLLGLIAPTSGSTRVFGSDPRQAITRTRVGAMLQVSRITEMLKVREHLDLFRSYYPNPLPIPDILGIAQLQGIEDRLFGQLSGGQKQRVLFALALCGNPDLIIVINKGRVICEGTPAEIKRNSGGRRIRCNTSLSTEVLQSLPSVTNVEQSGESTIVTATHAENVVREMLRRDETLSGLEIASPALEDAFLALTRN